GYYVVDIQHNLESENITYTIWENETDQVEVDRVSIINTNTIRLYVSMDPDCRFEGNIVLFKN
ncbi:MAG: hypothetical protein ACTSUP_03875, partial [Candidatus Heimdallarchaeaceae archaeon]